MAQRSDVTAVAVLCRALDGRDVGPLTARLDDASVLHMPGSSGLGGNYQGHEAIVGLLQRMAAATDRTLRFGVGYITASGPDTLRIQGKLHGKRNGRPLSATVSVDATLADHVFRSITILSADRSAWDAMWGRNTR